MHFGEYELFPSLIGLSQSISNCQNIAFHVLKLFFCQLLLFIILSLLYFKTAVPSWVPRMPNDSFDLSVFLTLSCISLALFVLGSIGYRRRDLLEG